MTLTPIDILHTEFKAALRGYNKRQVDDFVKSVREALEQALSERCELQRRADALQDELDRIRKIESTMANALTLAQKSAEELRATAHQQAELILQEAEQSRVKMSVDAQREVESLRKEIDSLTGTRDRFEAEFRSVLAAYQDLLDRRRIAIASPSVPQEAEGWDEVERALSKTDVPAQSEAA